MAKLIGTGTNQVPTNGMLGGMAFQTPEDVTVKKIQEEGYNVVTQTDIGTAPNQIPLNQFLGGLAYMDSVAGLDFSATSSSSTGTVTSQILDDYEEGTHTCTASNGVTLNSNANQISYTKIGRQVTVGGQIQVSNSNSNSALVLSLPFTVKNNSKGDALYTGAVRLYTADIAADAKWVICQSEPGTATVLFVDVRDNTITNPHACNANGYYMFTLTYPTA